MLNKIKLAAAVLMFGLLCAPGPACAQSNLWIYTDHLVNGFQDWSWAQRDLSNTNALTIHSGTNSIAVNSAISQGMSFHSGINIDTSIYSSLSFWAHGGTSGGQVLRLYATLDNTDQAGTNLAALSANSWKQYTVPLSTLHVSGKTNLTRITLQLNSGSTNTYYLDDIQLIASPAPALMHIGVDAGHTVRAADARWFGANTATWDGVLSSSQTVPLLKEMGIQALRWPGGSTSDGYHWASDLSGNINFMHAATNIGAKVFITANYGTGTSNEAAAWVNYFNITNHCGFKYWEIGNENYGTWENDNNNPAHDPFTYANRAGNYIALMKAADPTIHTGVVIVPGENTYSNNANHFAINPRTGTTNFGWTPVMLNTLRSNGVTPDFFIYHFYAQYTPTNWQPNVTDSDPLLLQAASNWAQDAADIRQQITDYFGPAGAGVELVCTENNSDAGSMGAQSTSVVNALYLADSASQLMKTEFNAYIWWDLRNGSDTRGAFDPTLYGWRSNGDYGFLSGSNARYPIFYAEKLLQYFVRAGDTVLNATSDSILLSAYASRKADGSLAMLVINKTPTNILNAQISLANFLPAPVAGARSWGQAQDEATRTNNTTPGAQDIATNTTAAAAVFTNSFPPYTLTLLTFSPTPSQLRIVSIAGTNMVFQLQGQPGAPYVIQSSSTPSGPVWTPVSTNILAASPMLFTNAIPTNNFATYWRSVWVP